MFSDPILKEIAETLLACLRTNPLATGTDVLARIKESGTVSNRITELILEGEQKGDNYRTRLEEAVDVLERSGVSMKIGEDSTKLLDSSMRVQKQNRHSLGLIE